jgi:hypothetical protein
MKAYARPAAQGEVQYPAESFHELSLSFIRTTATIAADAGQAVLWGHDAWQPIDRN